MAFSLYAATVPCFQQTLGAVFDLIGKAESFCAARGLDPQVLIQARLIDDMRPFSYQVKSTVAHSIGALDSLGNGVFVPDTTPPPASFPAMQTKVAAARAELARIVPSEIDDLVGKDMRFEDEDVRMEFTVEDFLLSFTMPNFYFHATTAYDILRMRGVQIGKSDFAGVRRTKNRSGI